MTKFLAKLFTKKKTNNSYMSPEEKYIRDRNPQSILDVENYSKQFERNQSYSSHRTWSTL